MCSPEDTYTKCCCCIGLKFSHTGAVSHVLQACLQLFRGPCIGDVLWEGGHHPVSSMMRFFFFCLSVPDSIEKKSEIKAEVLALERWCSIGDRPKSSIKFVLLVAVPELIDPNLPEWVISSHHLFTLPQLPVSSHQVGSVHGNAVLMCALWRLSHAHT